MLYFIKNGRETAFAIGFHGALEQLALAGDDAIILNVFGTCIAGRRLVG